MSRRGINSSLFLVTIFFVFFASFWPNGNVRADDFFSNEIAALLDAPGGRVEICGDCALVEATPELKSFYERRGFQPVWVGPEGVYKTGLDFAEILMDAADHGLDPADYDAACLGSRLESLFRFEPDVLAVPREDLAAVDVLLTASFLRFGRHLCRGRVNPAGLYALWRPADNDVDVSAVLTELERHGDVRWAVRELAPPHEEYWKLVGAGRRLGEIVQQGGWPELPQRIRLELGDEGPETALLRERLIVGGDLVPSAEDFEALFDADVELAVRDFQERHGLTPDGIVDKATIAALNAPAEKRWTEVMLNLERWRWLPREWGPRYVIINPAAFTLEAFDHGRRSLEMRVIVGKVATQTPVFSETIQYMEVNPYWYVPESIAVNMNKDNLAGRGYQTSGSGTIVQKPGPGNALGTLKFVFPNRFSVYMHDTPSRYLFARDYRAYSHGCIRLQQPVDMAVFLRQEELDWDREKVRSLIRRGATERIPVEYQSRVHVIYLTARVNDEGELEFRNDLYRRDPALQRALYRDGLPGPMIAYGPGSCEPLTASSEYTTSRGN